MSESTVPPAPYYQRHIFFCLNERDTSHGDDCCASHGSPQMYAYCKSRVKAEGLAGPGQVRVNKAGCFSRCAGAPVAVVYPEGVWYTYLDTEDVDEIIQSHLKHGQVVQRLLLPPQTGRWP